MPYLVLARKWRPKRFEDVVGQEHITRVLQNAIRAGRIAHAYLFTGVRGVGKTTAARILAKALNCEKGPTSEPCNECALCNEIMTGNSIDVYEIDGASNRGIDEVRQIIENVRYQPAKSRFKIYIIDEVHQVTKDAFNALLKTLEEPPPFVKFILATTEPHRLPETILSRCQRFDFRRIAVRDIVRRLADIAEKEGLRISEGALLLLAREAEGSMRDAQSLLEQILSFTAPDADPEKGTTEVDEKLLQDVLGIAERQVLYELSNTVIRGDAGRCVEMVAEVAGQGRDMGRLSRELVEHFRNLLVARLVRERQGGGADSATLSRLLDLPDQEIEDLKRQVSELSVDTLMDYLRFMAEGDEEVARSPYPRFALEATLIRLATLPKAMPIAEIVERLEILGKRLSEGGRRKDQGARMKDGEERRQAEGVRREAERERMKDEGGPLERDHALRESPAGDSREDIWKSFVAYVMREKKLLASHLEKVRPLDFPPGELRLGVEDRHHLNYLQDAENLTALRDLARRFFSGEVAVVVTAIGSGKQEKKAGPTEPAGLADPQNNNVVQDVLRIFGGSIKEVKRDN